MGAPDEAEVLLLSRGFRSAAAFEGVLTETQWLLTQAISTSMTGHPATADAPSISPDEFAAGLAGRTEEFRSRIVQVMVLLSLVLQPLPVEVTEQVTAFAAALGVEEGMLGVASEFASGSLGLAAIDFQRNGYTAAWAAEDSAALHTSSALTSAWEACADDAALAARWAAMEQLPEGTLGRMVSEFYRARGFSYPGRPGSAPPLLAQHDWVHVLADFGTTVESELEVFAFIARANDDLHGFSLLAMVVSLFETGYLSQGAGLFEASPGHLSEAGMATRVGDAMRRGALCQGSTDFLRLDWFAVADRPVSQVRARYGLEPKSAEALAAGSVGPWEPGGISEFQLGAGTAMAAAEGRPYESYGASLR
jgi:hypothetical protein